MHLATIVATSDATVDALIKATIAVKINGTFTSRCLIDSGSSENFLGGVQLHQKIDDWLHNPVVANGTWQGATH